MSDGHPVSSDLMWVMLGTSVLSIAALWVGLAVMRYLERKKKARSSGIQQKKRKVLKKPHKADQRH